MNTIGTPSRRRPAGSDLLLDGRDRRSTTTTTTTRILKQAMAGDGDGGDHVPSPSSAVTYLSPRHLKRHESDNVPHPSSRLTTVITGGGGVASRPDSGISGDSTPSDVAEPSPRKMIKMDSIPRRLINNVHGPEQCPEVETDPVTLVGYLIALLSGTDSELMSWDMETRQFLPNFKAAAPPRLTSDLVASIMERYSWHGQWMREIHDFVFGEQRPGADIDEILLTLTQTQKAFKSALRTLYIQLFNELTTAEELFKKYHQEKGSALSCDIYFVTRSLEAEETNFLLHRIELIARLFRDIKAATDFEQAPLVRSTRTINILYRALVIYSCEPSNLAAPNIVWSLFIGSLKPLMDFLESLLRPDVTNSCDQFLEFPVSVDESLVQKCTLDHDEVDFWKSCVLVQHNAGEEEIEFLAAHKEFILTTARSRILWNTLTTMTASTSDHDRSDPSIRSDPLDPTAAAGQMSLYQNFCNTFQAILIEFAYKSKASDVQVHPLAPSVKRLSGGRRDDDGDGQIKLQMPYFVDYSEFDPVSFHYLDLRPLVTSSSPYNEVPNIPWDVLPDVMRTDLHYSLPATVLMPMNLIIDRALSRALSACSLLAGSLVEAILPKFTEHLRTIHDYFLMLNGQEMSLFRDKLFPRLSKCLDIFSVDHIFQRSGGGGGGDSGGGQEEVRSFMTFDTQALFSGGGGLAAATMGGEEDPQELIKSVHLIYNGIQWPHCILLTPKVMDTYSRAFHFLLSVNLCRWTLNQIRHSQVRRLPTSVGGQDTNPSRRRRLHDLQMIKFTLDNTLATFELQVMSRIATSHEQLLADNAAAQDFEQLQVAHKKFLQRIRILTSQSTSSSLKVQPILSKFSAVTSKLRSIWNEILNSDKKEKIKSNQISAQIEHLQGETWKCVKLANFIRSF